MTELSPAPSVAASAADWKAYAEKLEQEVFDHINALEAAWLPKHVLLVAGVAFVAGVILGHVI